jgi:S1-C subfamily serine protease
MASRARILARTPFGSALLGGLIVGLLGWAAMAAGWIESDGGGTTVTQAPIAAPVAASDEGGSNESNVNAIYRADAPGVAYIEASRPSEPISPVDPFGQQGGGTATGSGFVIDTDGHILTNNHVVAGADEIRVTLGDSQSSVEAEKVGADPATDLALLKVDVPSSELHPLALGDSSDVSVGDQVVAIGNPFGLDRTVTTGIVSALQRQIQAPNGFSISNVIQTDAAINPGNSGGPLLNSRGEVIGVTSQIETAGGNGSVGVGFAIPINTASDVVSQLLDSGEVEHAYLGISGATITSDIADALNLPVDSGVLVQDAPSGGPADEAGIEGGSTEAVVNGSSLRLGGDIIVEADGRRIASMDQLVNVVNAADPGDQLELTTIRDGDRDRVSVTLGDRPARAQGTDEQPLNPFGR